MTTQALIVTFADALAEFLNAGTFAESFKAKREWLAIVDRADLMGLRVAVVPGAIEETAAARLRVEDEYTVTIAIQAPLPSIENSVIDQLCLLVDQIRDAVRFQPIGDAEWVSTGVPVLASQDDLIQLTQFTAAIVVTFSQLR